MERKIKGQAKIKCKEKSRHERRMPHLNNQIWIRARFVSDNTDFVNCIVYLHTHKRHINPFKITTSKVQQKC